MGVAVRWGNANTYSNTFLYTESKLCAYTYTNAGAHAHPGNNADKVRNR